MPVQFNVHEADPGRVSLIQREVGLPRFVAQTLVGRGIATPEAVRRFLHPSLHHDWVDPYEIPGMAQVADAVEAAMRASKRIVVFGDFDLDGISATVVLTRALRELGVDAKPFIPHRFDEGYGLSEAALARMSALEPEFIVTVDCGIASKVEIECVLALGIEVVVTDHHEPADLVPEGIPVADPKLDDRCQSAMLAGVGVALKLVQILGARFGRPYLWCDYVDFATLGTVADLMPMVGENRALVTAGLNALNQTPRPCVAAIMGTSGQVDKELTSTNLSFSLVPRLNAAGRMGDPELALDLLMSDDFEECCRLANRLEALNDQRRAIEAKLSEIAQMSAEELYDGQRVLVVAGEGWHEDVKGIVASRLVSTFGVPALLFSIDGDEARGSGRSVGTVNLFAAVESVADLVTRFGGHEAAVGVTLPVKNLPEFTRRLSDYLDTLPEEAFHSMVEIDALVRLEELSLDDVAKVELLAPFGQENAVPVYLARNVTLDRCRAVGADKNHFSCMLSDGRSAISGIMFHCPDISALLETECVVNAAFTVQIDEWKGRKSVKAMLKTLAPARACSGLEACQDPSDKTFFDKLYSQDAERFNEDETISRSDDARHEQLRRANRRRWEALASQDPDRLETAIIRAIIGDGHLHASQRAILDRLKANVSLLAIMATGRGKSLTFQVYAAWRALLAGEASLFVYPLRALIADQAFHLGNALEPFGIAVSVLTGESLPEERAEIMGGLASGAQDIVLTTPEYLAYHVKEFAATGRIGFVVVDEAHHIGQAKAGRREGYATLGQAISQLGKPTVLALTATAGDDISRDIEASLPLEDSVIDETARENLEVDDQRNIRNRDDYLAHLVAQGEKTVIYVNSREQSMILARLLRRRVPQLATMIGFYNAGLTRDERRRIETLFRDNVLTVLVATSAFGEGVDIPDIRHVVLYHLPFNEVEFNQMSGRAGRDGKKAVVHLLYGRSDVALNDAILKEMAPDHDVMAQVYRRLRTIQRANPGDYFSMGNVDLAEQASDMLHPVTPRTVASGVAVFRELGLIETRFQHQAGQHTRWIRVNESASKVELTDSVRYREGLDERAVFRAFRDWAMRCDSQGLRIRLSHPIIPREFPGRGI